MLVDTRANFEHLRFFMEGVWLPAEPSRKVAEALGRLASVLGVDVKRSVDRQINAADAACVTVQGRWISNLWP